MKRFLIVLLGIATAACTEISYKEPQPKGVKALTEIPQKFHGTYHWQGEQKDTIVFFKNGFRANNKNEKDVLLLNSDSLVLKKYKGYYFVNYRDHDNWILRLLKPQKNGDFIYLEMENVPDEAGPRKLFIDALSKETTVSETVKDSTTYYTIDPSDKKLYSLIEKGFFKEKAVLKKIN